MSVPSTEKCSSDSKALTRGRFSTAAMNAAAMSPSSSLVVERGQRVIGDTSDQTQRVVVGDPAFRAHIAEKSIPPIIPTTHERRPLPSIRCIIESEALDSRQGVFQQPARPRHSPAGPHECPAAAPEYPDRPEPRHCSRRTRAWYLA